MAELRSGNHTRWDMTSVMSARAPRPSRVGEAVREIHRLGINVVNMLSDEARWERLAAVPASERRIDVWWTDDDASRMALLLAYLFTRTHDWERAQIRILGSAPFR